MRNLAFLSAAAVLASTLAFNSTAQAAGCALYDPNCQTYPMPQNESARADVNRHRSISRAEGPADVAGAAIGTAGNIAVGAVDTAGVMTYWPFGLR
jgi:hypothetical protein